MRWLSCSGPVLAVALAVGCGEATRGYGEPDDDAGLDPDGPDGGRDDRTDAGEEPARCDPDKPFGSPVALSVLNDPDTNDDHVTLSADELTLFFHSDRTGGTGPANIYMATRSDRSGMFGPPSLAPNVNQAGVFSRGPSLSPDGLNLFFTRGDLVLATRIHVATRTSISGTFGAPTIVPNVNPAGDFFPSRPYMSADGRRLYFYSDENGSQDVFVASRSSPTAPFGTPSPVSGLSASTVDEMSPVLSADELTIYFARNSSATVEPAKIYVARRNAITDGFGAPTLVDDLDAGTTVNFPSYLTHDGCVMYFSRASGIATDFDLFVATRPR